ncbi:hypothetical protein DERP_010808 [Dermatophagoides pteronyssinus]|uniref:Uncharacterized protein n=1 Tax=Dermatophagoides pteronyssinus TaxID=6956 RepID=A0ABQ8J6T3_DERPT|nr:hypothetical protein DERP_010808 [Dermatophagoides pteronyssinus]
MNEPFTKVIISEHIISLNDNSLNRKMNFLIQKNKKKKSETKSAYMAQCSSINQSINQKSITLI